MSVHHDPALLQRNTEKAIQRPKTEKNKEDKDIRGGRVALASQVVIELKKKVEAIIDMTN